MGTRILRLNLWGRENLVVRLLGAESFPSDDLIPAGSLRVIPVMCAM